jgi:hypothetical protein
MRVALVILVGSVSAAIGLYLGMNTDAPGERFPQENKQIIAFSP